MERRAAVAHRRKRLLGERLDAHEPLIGEHRLDHRLAARADADGMLMRLHLLQQTQRRQVLDHLGAAILARHPAIRAGFVVHPPMRIHHGNLREIVPPAHLEVVEIVPRRDFDRARAESGIDIGIGDYRDFAFDERQHDLLADHRLVAHVIRMHRHGGVTQHRLGPRRRHGHCARAVGERVADVPEMAGRFLVIDFEVAKRRLASRAPVDQAERAIDQPLAIEPDENFRHRARETGVEREALAAPVA